MGTEECPSGRVFRQLGNGLPQTGRLAGLVIRSLFSEMTLPGDVSLTTALVSSASISPPSIDRYVVLPSAVGAIEWVYRSFWKKVSLPPFSYSPFQLPSASSVTGPPDATLLMSTIITCGSAGLAMSSTSTPGCGCGQLFPGPRGSPNPHADPPPLRSPTYTKSPQM